MQFARDEVFVDVGAYDGDTIQRFINVVESESFVVW